MTRVHQVDLKSVALQDLEKGDPQTNLLDLDPSQLTPEILDKLADHLLRKEFGDLPQSELEQIKAKLAAVETGVSCETSRSRMFVFNLFSASPAAAPFTATILGTSFTVPTSGQPTLAFFGIT